MSIDKKSIFRKHALTVLRETEKRGAYIYDKKINDILNRILVSANPSSVMVYVPMSIEVDIGPLISRLRKKGVDVYVPFMVGESFVLVKYRLPLRRKQYGVYEPKFSKQYRRRRIDIAIVPIVGTDITFRRIGFGRGMYDRFFEKEKKYIEWTIFIQRVLCCSPEQITDDHDVEAACIVSKEGCLIKR